MEEYLFEEFEETKDNTPPETPTNVYIKINSNSEIVKVDSDAFIKDTSEWIKIDSGYGDKFRLAINHYFDKPLINEDGTYNYKYENGKIIGG